MKPVDLTHTFTIHTPGWVGYPSPTLSYFQRHATNGIVSQKIDLPLHSGTHFDAEMHIVSGGKDMASVPLDTLCREGVIVDISEDMDDWTVIKPEHITSRVEVKKGDILLYHTGWQRFYNGREEEDEERYFLRHPGGDREFAEWIVDMELAWTGFDTGSGDHPMNTSIRFKRPDAAKALRKDDRQGHQRGVPGGGHLRDAQGAIPPGHHAPREPRRRGRRAGQPPLHDRRLPDPDRGRRGIAVPRRRVYR